MQYREVIRSYSRTVETGHSDTDLTPRQRRLVVVMLNLTSNEEVSHYPPTETERVAACKRLGAIMWDARFLIRAAVPAADDDIEIAIDRTFHCLREM